MSANGIGRRDEAARVAPARGKRQVSGHAAWLPRTAQISQGDRWEEQRSVFSIWPRWQVPRACWHAHRMTVLLPIHATWDKTSKVCEM
jgi:hypothetical protein